MKLPVNYNNLCYKDKREVREEYIKLQDGLCYYCGNLLDGPPENMVAAKKVTRELFPEGFFEWPVHLHHDHVTGMTQGAVHNYCNAVLWEYENK